MTTTKTAWPGLPEYQTLMGLTEPPLLDSRLRGIPVQKSYFAKRLVPTGIPGRFGVVFKLLGDPPVALKVFLGHEPEREERYRLITAALQEKTPPALLKIEYQDEGIEFGPTRYPTLRMEWCDAVPLEEFLKERVQDGGVDNLVLCRNWIADMSALRRSGIAHGDLHHGNIRVAADGTFRLVDYDGMFVPAMAARRLRPLEMGRPGYQHPYRDNTFDASIDNFSALVILLTLAAIDAEISDRFKSVMFDDECVLISANDLSDPSRSAMFRYLDSRGPLVRKLAAVVARAATGPFADVPSFDDVIASPEIAAELQLDMPVTPRPVPISHPLGESELERAMKRQQNSVVPPDSARRAVSPPGNHAAVVRPAAITLDPGTAKLVRLVASGASDESIAREYGLTTRTITRRVNTLHQIAGTSKRPELLAWAKSQFPNEPPYRGPRSQNRTVAGTASKARPRTTSPAARHERQPQPTVTSAPASLPTVPPTSVNAAPPPDTPVPFEELRARWLKDRESLQPSLAASAATPMVRAPAPMVRAPAPKRTFMQRIRDRWRKA